MFHSKKVQFQHSALIYVAMTIIQLFDLVLKTQISIVFQVFPNERNFLWDNLLYFRHHNTLRSSIKANIRTVTMENSRKSFCPKMVIDTKTDKRHVYSLKSAFYATGILSGALSLFLTLFLAHSSDLSFVIAPALTLMASVVTASN